MRKFSQKQKSRIRGTVSRRGRDPDMTQVKLENDRSGGANLGFETKLWKAADKLRSNTDAAEYKHVVLGLLFLKYISDAFNEVHEQLKKDTTSDLKM